MARAARVAPREAAARFKAGLVAGVDGSGAFSPAGGLAGESGFDGIEERFYAFTGGAGNCDAFVGVPARVMADI